MSKIYALRLFIDGESIQHIIDVCKNVLTDTGFVCERVLVEDVGLVAPDQPGEHLEENKFEKIEFAHTDIEYSQTEMRHPTEPTEALPYYSVGITFTSTTAIQDREFQQTIVQLISELSKNLNLFYSFLEPVSHTIMESAEQMQNRPNLGYVTYLREDLAEQLGGDVSSAPYGNIESVGGGYLIVPDGDFLDSGTQLAKLASHLETSHIGDA